MFTGIIESTGKVISLKKKNSNLEIIVECNFASELKEGQSIAHNGICLTAEKISGKYYSVTAVKETLSKTNLGKLKVGNEINLERALKVGDRLDGHFVQGHVDTTAKVKSIKKEKGSWIFKFEIRNSKFEKVIIEKGSVCINGVSLTVVDVEPQTTNHKPRISFSVAIIPFTYSHTNFKHLKIGDEANLEFDIFGKYINKIISAKD